MKRLSLILLSLCLSVAGVQARKWLPAPDAPRSEFRLLGCTYRGADLESLDLLSAAGDHGWTVDVDRTSVDGGVRYTFRFVAQRAMENAGVAVAFDHGGW